MAESPQGPGMRLRLDCRLLFHNPIGRPPQVLGSSKKRIGDEWAVMRGQLNLVLYSNNSIVAAPSHFWRTTRML